MKHSLLFDALAPMHKALNAPAFTQEKSSLSIIANSLRLIDDVKARQAWSKQLPFSPAQQSYALKPTSLVDVEVLRTLGRGGSLVDEKS